jgi:hypothetical protein
VRTIAFEIFTRGKRLTASMKRNSKFFDSPYQHYHLNPFIVNHFTTLECHPLLNNHAKKPSMPATRSAPSSVIYGYMVAFAKSVGILYNLLKLERFSRKVATLQWGSASVPTARLTQCARSGPFLFAVFYNHEYWNRKVSLGGLQFELCYG